MLEHFFYSGDIEGVKEYAGNVDLERNIFGYTALMLAAANGTYRKPMFFDAFK